MVQVKDGKGTVIQRTDDEPGALYRGPLLVMVGRRSASASEIVAGALQNYGRAIVVGEKSTHGKGTVQAVVELGKFLQRADQSQPKAGAMKLTIQKFYLPNGHSTQNRGVIPDITIPSPLDHMKIGEADLPNSMPWDTIQPTRFDALSISPSVEALLKDKSQQRLATDPDMAFLREDIEKIRTRMETGTISLNETRRLEEKKIEDGRNQERKKIEGKALATIVPTIHVVMDGKKNIPVATPDNPKKKKNPALEEAADGETAGITDAVDLAETLELQEGLRIMTDWLALSRPTQTAAVAKEKNPDTATSVK